MEQDMVDVHEAEANIEALIERVEGGARIAITRGGHPIAELVPTDVGETKATEADR